MSKKLQRIQNTTPQKYVNQATIMIQKISNKYSSKELLEEIGQIIPKYKSQGLNQKEELALAERIMKATSALALKSHHLAAETAGKYFRPFVVNFTKDLIKEYNCQSPSEIALAEIVASSYGRYLEYSNRLSNYIEVHKNVNTGDCLFLGKEVDRAHRQFITTLTTLKQIKSPTLEVKVKTKTAFISQNQQVNSYKENNKQKDEIIEPK